MPTREQPSAVHAEPAIRLHRDAEIVSHLRIYAGLFRAGDSLRHPIEAGWGGWVQVVDGELRVAGLALHPGDGAGITDVSQLEFTFDADSEVLLFEVHMDAPLLWR